MRSSRKLRLSSTLLKTALEVLAPVKSPAKPANAGDFVRVGRSAANPLPEDPLSGGMICTVLSYLGYRKPTIKDRTNPTATQRAMRQRCNQRRKMASVQPSHCAGLGSWLLLASLVKTSLSVSLSGIRRPPPRYSKRAVQVHCLR